MPNSPDQRRLPAVEVRKASASHRKSVTINREDLDWAAQQGLLPANQVNALWTALAQRSASGFDFATLLYYGGGSIVLLAMGWFMFLMTAQYQAPALIGTSLAYAAVFVGLGSHLYFRQGLRVPGGILFTLAVSVTPLLVLGLFSLAGIPDLNNSQQLVLELATVVASVVALTFVRFPFLTMPLFGSLWMMAMTLTSMVGNHSSFGFGNDQLLVSMGFGALMTTIAFAVDRRTGEDFSFWGYLFGVGSFWLSWTFLDKGGEPGLFVYFLGNLALLLASVLLQRWVFLVTGALGATGYLMYEVFDKFKDSMLMPVALSAIGIGVIIAGIVYTKNKARIDGAILGMLPDALIRSLPHNR